MFNTKTVLHIYYSKPGGAMRVTLIIFLLLLLTSITAISKSECRLLELMEEGSYSKVIELIEGGADFTGENKMGRSVIHLAAAAGKISVLKTLIEKGADIDTVSVGGYKQTPLIEAAANGNLKTVKYLISNGADIEAQDMFGRTALFHSLNNRKLETARFLIKSGSPLNTVDDEKQTPLHLAVSTGNPEIVSLLLEHGATIEVYNSYDLTPLDLARQFGFEMIVKIIESGLNQSAQ